VVALARLEFLGVEKTYPGGIAAIRGVDLTVEDGELFVILGPSGS
jgi:ABC-type Fe3+/spermidine/putrescine transport system ATPase subunit